MGHQPASARKLVAVVIRSLASLLGACSSSSNPTSEVAVRVTYEDMAPAGYVDQTVTLEYSGSSRQSSSTSRQTLRAILSKE